MNNDNIFDGTIDVLIKYAGTKAADRIFDEIDNSMQDSDINFSEKHIRRINKIISAERNKIKKADRRRVNKRILLAAVIAAITLLLSAMTVGAFREKIIDFFEEITNVGTVFHYEGDTDEEITSFTINIKYIPDGFEQSQEYSNSNEHYIRYIKGEQFFDVSKQIMPDSYTMNTENADIKNININGIDMFFSSSDKVKIITWIKAGYLYTVSGNVSEDEIINIVKNII